MSDLPPSFMDLLKQDHRYPKEAYFFVFETLDYAQKTLKMGKKTSSEPLPAEIPSDPNCVEEDENDEDQAAHHHISGQELSLAARQYAIDQYGALAKTVLNSIGIHCTGDFGEIVYNMIRIGRMRKTPEDKREDFDNVFDFDEAFENKYHFGTT